MVDTLQDARAGSTRALYNRRWGHFERWCLAQSPQVDPFRASVEDVLRFLQSKLDDGRRPSTLRGWVAAITACHEGMGGQPLSQHSLIADFQRGARRRCPASRPLFPSWELAVVLEALCEPPFEPIESLELKFLGLKTLLLVALTTAKRVSDLQALSVSSECLRFDGEGRRALLKPNLAFVPKNLLVALNPVELVAFHPPPFSSTEEERLHCLCPVRALQCYVQKTAGLRQTSQLFVTHGPGRGAGRAAARPTLSRWLVEAIRLAYSSKGLDPPEGIRAHSTRGASTSWAVTRGVSIQEVCMAANWASSSTFATFYRLDVAAPTVAHAVLGVADASVQGI